MTSVASTGQHAGDVDARHGPIDADHGLHIAGSVHGVDVRSAGDVRVEGDIDGGALVEARGEVCVGGRISDGGTRVVAHAGARATAVEGADVVSRGDIVVVEGVRNARLQAAGRLDADYLHGGQLRAVRGVSVTGDVAADTHIQIVHDPQSSLRLTRVHEGLELCERDIARILRALKISAVTAVEIRAAVAALTGEKRRFALQILKQLQQLVQLRQTLQDRRQAHEERLDQVLREARIVVGGTVHAGACIGFLDERVQLPEAAADVEFHLAKEGIRW